MTWRRLSALAQQPMSDDLPAGGLGTFEWWAACDDMVATGTLKRTAKHVALEASRFGTTTTGENVRPAQKTIAARAGLSVRAVGVALAELVELGLLEVVREATPRAPKEYRLTRPRPRPAARSGQARSAFGSDLQGVRVRPEAPSYDLTTTAGLTSPNTSPPEAAPVSTGPLTGAAAWARVAELERLAAQRLADYEALVLQPLRG